MKRNNKKHQVQRTTTLNGMMTFGLVDNNLHILDFCSTDFAEVRNTPLFREDNCSFSLGQDGRYYFVFTMPQEQVDELPEQLVLQAVAIAQKVIGIRN